MTVALTREEHARMCRIAGMLGSDHDGEVLAAVRALRKIAADHHLRVDELLLGARPHVERVADSARSQTAGDTLDQRERLRRLLAMHETWPFLSAWERDFIRNVMRQRDGASPKQTAILDSLWAKRPYRNSQETGRRRAA